jgi:hypothetical protein
MRLVVAVAFFSAARAGMSEAKTFFIADGLLCFPETSLGTADRNT